MVLHYFRTGAFIFSLLAIADASAENQRSELSGFDCLIEPHSMVALSTREEGILEEVLVDRGDLIERGQVLAKLDSAVEQATVDLAMARTQMQAELQERRESWSFAKRELARIKELLGKKAISLNEEDRARTQAERARLQLSQTEQRARVAKLELERAQKVLSRRTVLSPITGIVLGRGLSVGESVEGQTIMELAAVDPLNVELIVPVEHFGRIKAGMMASVTPKYPGSKSHEAKVVIVDQVMDAASDTFGVRLELPNPKKLIPAGVRCSIAFYMAR